MFTINLTAYGYGVGLVLVGFAAGILLSHVFSVIRGVTQLGGGR